MHAVSEAEREKLAAAVIRIHDHEYASIPGGRYTHFNLAEARHAVGERYSLPRILRSGQDPAIPPLLAYNAIWVGLCVEFIPRLPFDGVARRHYDSAMTHIADRTALEEVIWQRYSRSRPGLAREAMLEAGVSVTVLDLFGTFDLGSG